ncbi:MAG: bifunctional diaminohydroxyphosphoribosylaminopyrimidine deaminase/5-amino-6-(5-phosphoribosylamino)uracil reductase RibD [Alphaproteobacteria bacterium]|nr:bifunctional diaminohydroxyphosphoribosylaminopyrimidine deaminase/5-amino-6-(5-phosphoribosylamino)uracil reductase RibD [Alphaproteobacteria bacterium]
MNHKKFMQIALQLAQSGKGLTFPNPSVGAVLVRVHCHDTHIIASARTANAGRPHAETLCLQKTDNIDALCVLYVTLEPCAHQGETPPCVDAIIASHIKHVVIGVEDGDEKTRGKGAEALKKAGITVEYENLDGAINEFYKGYLRQRAGEKPFVAVKIAASLDGKIALHNGNSKWITGKLAREYGHLLRAHADCVLTGAGTILADNPRLNIRLNGFKTYQTMRVILTGARVLPDDANIFNADDGDVMIVADKNSVHFANYQRIANNAPQKMMVQEVGAQNEKINLPLLLQKLGQFGIADILLEAGSKLMTEFLTQNLVDRIYYFQNQQFLGADSQNAIGVLGLDKLSDAPQFHLHAEKQFLRDDDMVDKLLILDRVS